MIHDIYEIHDIHKIHDIYEIHDIYDIHDMYDIYDIYDSVCLLLVSFNRSVPQEFLRSFLDWYYSWSSNTKMKSWCFCRHALPLHNLTIQFCHQVENILR